jgi:hypothetical protein
MMLAGRLRRAALGTAVACTVLAACGSDSSPPSTATPSPVASAPAAGPAGPTAPVTALNRTTPRGPLTPAQLRDLVVYFENRLSEAYAAGDTSHLGEFLAGPELTGISATITTLNKRNQRNIFHVLFDHLDITSAEPDQMIFHMVDHTTDNHFVDITTGQVVNQGYPGPQVQAFTEYFSYNDGDHTWYWTGAQNETGQ